MEELNTRHTIVSRAALVDLEPVREMKQAMRGELWIVNDELQSIELFIIYNLVFSLIPST